MFSFFSIVVIFHLIFVHIFYFLVFSEKTKKKYNLSNQLFRSGTSIGANVKEAQNAESKADFIHKMKIAIKEADETEYWLMLCKHSKEYPDTSDELMKLSSIIKILNKIIGTSKTKNNY